MAASALDKARKSYSYLQKTLNTGINASDLVLTPNNVTNIPTDTGVSFVIDRVDSSGAKTPTLRELMTGYVSGGTLTSLIRGEQGTTAQAHLAGAVIEFVNSGEMWNDLIDFLLQDHSNPNGNHKTLTDDNGNEWLERGSVASAANQVKVTNAITGKNPKVSASGDDTNIQLDLDGKGTGYAVARNPELVFDHIAAGSGVWSGLGYASTLTAAMTALTCYINGRRISISAIATRTFTASKDTYVDVLDNLDGTGTIVYTEVANNAASPALASNSIRLAIVVSGATNIAAAASINQGQEDRVLPIASSIPYTVTDSLGNLICPRDPHRKLLGYRQVLVQSSTSNATATQITGLSVPYLPVAGRKVKVTAGAPQLYANNVSAHRAKFSAWDGVVGSGTLLQSTIGISNLGSSSIQGGGFERVYTPASTALTTVNGALNSDSAGVSAVIDIDGAGTCIWVKVELE
jgi:hypothetical protein